MKERQGAKKIPRFRSHQEAGALWDSHSPEEFPGQFQEVRGRFSSALIKRGLTIKLSEETIDELWETARRQGIGLSTPARMWILEHLRELKQGRIEKPDCRASLTSGRRPAARNLA